jgi:MFS transporter, LPLT family, lysophospholipid transporter
MTAGFYIILAAQFLSALADNALLFGAIALLIQYNAPPEFTPILQQSFVFSYIVLAPFVGAFADALPKGRVMFISNTIKFVGCLAMLFGMHPLLAYAIVGLGAAAYSPAKYGILTEYLPPSKLVLANSWMEGLTVLSIILGAVVGGMLINPKLKAFHATTDLLPLVGGNAITSPEFAIAVVTLLYVGAAIVNLYIPKVAIDHKLPKKNPAYILHDFWHCFTLLWRDPMGRVSLAVTTLFWGVGATLRLIVLVWAGLALKFDLERATQLTAVTAVGIAMGAVLAARYVTLERSVRVLPMGIAMGIVVLGMVFVHDWRVAVVLLILAGAMGGFFVVPMNALLQHRGHLLMGAGHSIAVQNFNENISILLMLGGYALMIRYNVPMNVIILLFGFCISGVMGLLYRRYRHLGVGRES